MAIRSPAFAAAIVLLLGFAGARAQIQGPAGGLNSGATDGDLILGFTNPTATPAAGDLVFDIGPADNYYSTIVGGSLTPGSTYVVAAYSAADVASTFGSGAFTSGQVLWGIIGGNSLAGGPGSAPINTLWAATPGSTALRAGSAQSTASQDIDGFTDSSVGGGAQLADNPDATNIPFSVGFYNQAVVSGSAANGTFGYFSSSILGTLGTNASMQLYELIPPSGAGQGESIDLGSFSLSSSSLVYTASDLPAITSQPVTQTVVAGSGVVLSVEASGKTPVSYQWYLNGSPISNATEPVLALTDVQSGNAGVYTVEVSDTLGNQVTSGGANLTVTAPVASDITTQPMSQTIATGDTVAFTVSAGGAAQTSSLSALGGPSAKLSPGTTYQWQFNGTALSDGSGISGSTGPQLVIGAAGAADTGDYSCIVTTGGTAAQSLTASLVVENTANPGYLINLSGRGFVGVGDNILIGGFYIGGSTSCTVLVQALGPALAKLDVTGALQHPALTIHDSTGAVIYANTGWGSSPILLNAAAAAYANPPLLMNSDDSEALLTLPPGGYTAEISGADGGTGVALCAIYQLP